MGKKFKEIFVLKKRSIVVLLICSFVIFGTNLIKPLLNSRLIDKGLMELNIKTTFFIAVMLIVLVLLDKIIEYIQENAEIEIKQFTEYSLKIDIFKHAIKLKDSYYKQMGFLKILSDAYWDLDNILMLVENNFLTVFILFLKAIGATLALFVINPKLAIVILCCVPIKYLLCVIFSKYIVKMNIELMKINQEYNSWYEDTIEGIMDIKLWNLGKQKCDEIGEYINRQNKCQKKISLLRKKRFSIDILIDEVLTYVLYVLGLCIVLSSDMTIGNIITVACYSSYLLSPVNVILNLGQTLDEIRPALANLNIFFEMAEEQTGKLPMPDTISKLEFKNVGYKIEKTIILENFSVTILKGQKVAIVGDNGTGKSTLINLLLRIVEPTEGVIAINDIPIQCFDLISYRNAFSSIMQEIHIFTGSVLSNILINGDCISDSKIKEIFRYIYKNDISEIRDIGQSGKKLSGGERQKIAYMRAICNKRKFIIMDEPTSAYDAESIIKFCEYMQQNTDFDFYITITHDPQLLYMMDNIIKLESRR